MGALQGILRGPRYVPTSVPTLLVSFQARPAPRPTPPPSPPCPSAKALGDFSKHLNQSCLVQLFHSRQEVGRSRAKGELEVLSSAMCFQTNAGWPAWQPAEQPLPLGQRLPGARVHRPRDRSELRLERGFQFASTVEGLRGVFLAKTWLNPCPL